MLSSLTAPFALFSPNTPSGAESIMRTANKTLITLSLMVFALGGCVVAPMGWHRGYYRPRVAVVAPLPLVVVRPYR